MTFAVVQMENGMPKKVVGTIWASEESQATMVARDLCGREGREVSVRRTEEREIPLKLMN